MQGEGEREAESVSKLIDLFVSWWLHRCKHRGEQVAADIADGDLAKLDTQVQYCRRCGAVRFCDGAGLAIGYWRRPEPAWYPASGGER